jgi:23S rRNA (pseudouridine1915-N3)-methyltransferase
VIQIITIGHKMPDWIKSGFDHYHKKIQMKCKLIEIHPQNQKNITKFLDQKVSHIALDSQGKQFKSEHIAEQINIWKMDGINVNFYIGAHDGLPPEVLERCQKKWSLSNQTYPHHLIKIMLIEQLYRSECILNNHPYHK